MLNAVILNDTFSFLKHYERSKISTTCSLFRNIIFNNFHNILYLDFDVEFKCQINNRQKKPLISSIPNIVNIYEDIFINISGGLRHCKTSKEELFLILDKLHLTFLYVTNLTINLESFFFEKGNHIFTELILTLYGYFSPEDFKSEYTYFLKSKNLRDASSNFLENYQKGFFKLLYNNRELSFSCPFLPFPNFMYALSSFVCKLYVSFMIRLKIKFNKNFFN